tara:strand:+ start:217 stop:1467 length:1251 start_codon:yes stop_codon:yes gene_type:complete
MEFKFLGNAGGIFKGSKGTKVLCDPWIVDGVFEGSWYHYPPLKTKISDLKDVDAIYLSHIHPDHYDERYFDFSKNIPIIILNEGPNFLKKNLIKKGFKNFIEIKNDQTSKFEEFDLTLYKPFSKHIYEESLLGNLIDSALVIQDNDVTAINFNDNSPDEEACAFLNKKFKKIDLAMVSYNAAGPYPSCFNNLDDGQKKNESKRILKRNFDHLCKIIPILKPKAVLPFAGSYILGGKNYYKNEYLGTTTWDECADYLKENLNYNSKIITLRENQRFDLLNQKQLEKYERINLLDMKKYIQFIKNNKYDYEKDNDPDELKLIQDLKLASEKMIERLKSFKVNLNTNVYIQVKENSIQVLRGDDKDRKLFCNMDNKLLRRILDRKAHWNNAEVGAHITFKRYPNKMEPDTHLLMSFFHL